MASGGPSGEITLPKAVVSHFPDVDYFDVQEEGDRIILLPVRSNQSDKVRQRFDAMGLNDQDVKDAIAWVRES